MKRGRKFFQNRAKNDDSHGYFPFSLFSLLSLSLSLCFSLSLSLCFFFLCLSSSESLPCPRTRRWWMRSLNLFPFVEFFLLSSPSLSLSLEISPSERERERDTFLPHSFAIFLSCSVPPTEDQLEREK